MRIVFSETPYEATKRVRGVPKQGYGSHAGGDTGTFSTVDERAAPACRLRHWDLRWSSLWGHETCEGCADIGGRDTCGLCHWDLRWGSLWGHETCEGCAETGAVTHAGPATAAFGGAPYGATTRVRGVPE